MATKHIGFKKAVETVSKDLQKKGKSKASSDKSAGAIVASSSRNASPAAKAANPKLKKVKGVL